MATMATTAARSFRALPRLLRPLPARAHSSSSSSSSSHSTVNQTEVSHFNALASSWWDPHGPSRLLHLMNPLRHDFISSCRSTSSPASPPDRSPASPPLPQNTLRYLDIGCGGGIFAESAARLPSVSSVTGIDPTPKVLDVARSHAALDPSLHNNPSKLQYLNSSIEALPLPASPAAAYDVVALWEVIEHVDAPGPFLEECVKHVRPGGWLVLSTIARTWTSWALTKVVAEDLVRIVPRGTHDWEKYLQESELREWFAKRPGWGEMRAKGCAYVPGMGWKWVEGGERWGNYFFAARKNENVGTE